MTDLTPLETLYDSAIGEALPLPPELESLYGALRFPPHPGRPYVVANFVSTLDGVVALGIPGVSGGSEISGANRHDRMLMGLLRAAADAVVVGAGTLRAVPRHVWAAERIFSPLAGAYRELRAALGKPAPALNVFVSASGALDLGQRVFQSGEAPVLIATTATGARRLHAQGPPASVQVVALGEGPAMSARAILDAIAGVQQSDLILTEGGPRLIGGFFAERCLDELFLTLAPQIAGRDDTAERLGLVAGTRFAPEQPLWGRLLSVRRGGSHLFLRYAFETVQSSG